MSSNDEATAPPARSWSEAGALARQRRQFQQAPGFIIAMSGPEHIVDFVNDEHRRLFASEHWPGRTIREAFPSLDGQGFLELLDDVYRTGETHRATGAEVRYSKGPGQPEETRFLDFTYSAVSDEQGRTVGIFCIGFDVTDTRKAESALRELNAELERKVAEKARERSLTWQVSPDLLGALGSDGYFVTSNPAWQTVLGWSESEVASMSIFEMLHPDDVDRTRAGFELTQIGQPAIRFPNRYRRKDGSYRWISWVGVLEGGLVYCSGRDITEEREQGEALEKTQEALRQAHKMEAVGQLTGGIAHDFNNLLAGISGSLEVIELSMSRGDPANAERFLATAKGAVKRAAALTHRLLSFSRRQALDPRATNLNQLVGGMEDLIRRAMGPGVHVEVVGAGGLWAALVDQNQLENALLNICVNARDAMPDGGRITIETANKWLDDRAAAERDLPPGQYVSLCVTDTGVGMTPTVAARAFDPFFTTKPLGAGTGLGLSMAYGFARQSGGQVRIYSEVGKGTTVCIYLPRHGEEPSQRAADAVRAEAHARGDGRTVLVIDDEPSVRILVVEALREAGYAALEASDGPSGLRALKGAPDIAFMITDVGLPGGMNGRQVADAARVDRPNLKVLFITGYAENAVIGSGHLDQGMALLTKPFAMADLGRKIREMLS